MDIKHIVSWSATLSQFGLLSTGISVCLKIRQQGSTKNITSFPFFTTCLSSTLWTKYGILTNDTALCVVGVAGIVLQSIYLASILLSKYRGKGQASFVGSKQTVLIPQTLTGRKKNRTLSTMTFKT
ncbi:sugar transporter SWEET1-like isoform X1 [Acropora palmata]|uniref:sugar transporter SWEET1-like isoform X1 n=1 Tax=Acropora palmata TaxID=6131 RepID=UPI003DA132C0